MKLLVELVKISLIKSVETSSTDNFHSLQMPTILTITIFDKFKKMLSICLPIFTFILTKKIYPLFNIFIVRPTILTFLAISMSFRGNFRQHWTCVRLFYLKINAKWNICTDLYPKITLSQSECSLMSHDLMLSVQT